jgi:DNA polymerase-3 subunit gamma/tau
MRSHFRLPIEQLVYHLSELQQLIGEKSDHSSLTPIPPEIAKAPAPLSSKPSLPVANPKPNRENNLAAVKKISSPPVPANTPLVTEITQTSNENFSVARKAPNPPASLFDTFVSEDPTPTPADLGKAIKTAKIDKPTAPAPKSSATSLSPAPLVNEGEFKRPLHEYDTLMHFAAVELEGRLQKNSI